MGDGYQSQEPDGIAALVARIRKLEQRQDAQRSALAGIGLHIDGVTGDLIIDSNALLTSDFDGTLSPPAAGNNGVAISGGTIIANAAVFKALVIPNSALAGAITAGVANGTTTGITLPTSDAVLRTDTITVPSGFAKAFVIATIQVGGVNPIAATIGVHATARINGNDSDDTSAVFPQTQGHHAEAALAISLTGLSGSLSVSAIGRCSNAGFTNATARIAALAIFAR